MSAEQEALDRIRKMITNTTEYKVMNMSPFDGISVHDLTPYLLVKILERLEVLESKMHDS